MGTTYSRDQVTNEKQRYLVMPLHERRRHYHPYKTLDAIKEWRSYYLEDIRPREAQRNPAVRRPIDDAINRKVSLYSGDITELEVDAIVHPGPSSTWRVMKGEVTNAIYTKIGAYFKDDYHYTGIRERGEAWITGGFKLPAKYIINTIPPKLQDRDILRQCYQNSLDLAKRDGLKTVAFPCIATKKANSFPRDEAASLALEAVRDWMEDTANCQSIDRIVFCCYKSDDLVQYNWKMQEYFPVDSIRSSGARNVVDQPSGASAHPPSVPGFAASQNSKSDVIRQEKDRFLGMSLPEKRSQYLVNYIDRGKVVTWARYSIDTKDKWKKVCSSFVIDDALNRKVAVWRGDITELEIDAIVNSAAQHGGKVNTVILANAGETYREECELIGHGNPGEARITGGYRLPAKYIINTYAPRFRDENIFKACYENCLNEAQREGIRTLAFPCIATRKFNGLASHRAASLALRCVRQWLEHNHRSVDLVIFCVFSKDDHRIYEELMHEYFPVS